MTFNFSEQHCQINMFKTQITIIFENIHKDECKLVTYNKNRKLNLFIRFYLLFLVSPTA